MSEYDLGGLDYATFVLDHQSYRYLFLSGLVILLYDHILTFGSEFELVWSRKLKPSTCWFLAVRYISLACTGVIIVFYFGDLSKEVCVSMERTLEGLLVVLEALVQFTLFLRVFAMYGFKLWVLLPMSLAADVSAGMGAWTIIGYGRPRMLTAPGMLGCHTAIPHATAFRLAGVWEAQMLFDLIVFGLTVYRAYQDQAVITMVRGSLIERMARDGAMYWAFIALASFGNVFTCYFGDVIIAGVLAWWTTSLSVALISRLNLNLQSMAAARNQTEDFDTTERGGIHFVTPQGPRRAGTTIGLVSEDLAPFANGNHGTGTDPAANIDIEEV